MKAIALISGGLDSTLATRLMQTFGLELIGLHTLSPFCLCNRRSSSGCFHGASSVAKDLGVRLVNINVAEEFLEIVKRPPHGYGSNMNPCIDCRILLFKKARQLMQQENAAFVITGEVLGQRPMSQKLNTMRLIEKEAGLEGLVLRPLSAKVLEATIPEQKGLVSRDKLLAISGRGRKQQFALASDFGIKDYPCPSGGCLLTDPEFCRRLKDLMQDRGFSLEDVNLLKLGRHFRLSPFVKLVVGRNEKENQALFNLARGEDYLFFPPLDIAGPTALARGRLNKDMIEISCRIASRYCDLNGNRSIKIGYRMLPQEKEDVFEAEPMEESVLANYRI